MIEELIAYVLKRRGHHWMVGGKPVQPTEEDVQTVLDEAAKTLYTMEPGTTFETGGIKVEKTARGHDIYVYVGHYL